MISNIIVYIDDIRPNLWINKIQRILHPLDFVQIPRIQYNTVVCTWGNRVYYGLRRTLRSSIFRHRTKLGVYKTLMPVSFYGTLLADDLLGSIRLDMIQNTGNTGTNRQRCLDRNLPSILANDTF